MTSEWWAYSMNEILPSARHLFFWILSWLEQKLTPQIKSFRIVSSCITNIYYNVYGYTSAPCLKFHLKLKHFIANKNTTEKSCWNVFNNAVIWSLKSVTENFFQVYFKIKLKLLQFCNFHLKINNINKILQMLF